MPSATIRSPLGLAVEQAVNNVNNVDNDPHHVNASSCYLDQTGARSFFHHTAMSRKRRRDGHGPDGPPALDARDTPERLATFPHLSSSSAPAPAPAPAALRKTVPFPAPKKVRLTSDALSPSSTAANVVSPPCPNAQRPTKPWSSNLKPRDDQSTPTTALNNSSSCTATPTSSTSASAFSSSTTTTTTNANGNANVNVNANANANATATATSSMTNRCHICYRKPTKKADLDSFADCQGCGQRTCFICIRECMGWMPGLRDGGGSALLSADSICHADDHHSNAGADEIADSSFTMMQDVGESGEGEEGDGEEEEGSGGNRQHTREGAPNGRHAARGHKGTTDGNHWAEGGHRQMVCSRCCIERGSDGDVVCLGCLPFVEG